MTRPEYIARGCDLVMAPPLALDGATMYSFVVNADLAALQALCDQQLNAVAGAGVYKPLLPLVAIVCAEIASSCSTVSPDSQKDWLSQRDFGIWIPVVRDGKIGWYRPYVFVDNVAAMFTGREAFGSFKQTATLTMPASPGSSGAFAVDALVVRKFSPQSQAEVLRLMTLMSVDDEAAPAGSWTGVEDAFEDVWGELKEMIGDVRGLPISLGDPLKNAFGELVTGDVPMVFLKQLRDGYQAVIEAPAHLVTFHGGWFTHPHDLAITPVDSHPIASECGLASGTLRAELGFWCQIDFVMKAGVVIAER